MKLKEIAVARSLIRTHFENSYGPVVRQDDDGDL
jgi:hypothetical protein